MTQKSQKTREQRELSKIGLLTPELIEKVKDASFRYKGDGTILESAIGALIAGQIYGWKVLRLTHSGRTYARYQQILDVKFKDVCPPEGPLAERSVALVLTKKINDFWSVASGDKPGRSPELDVPEVQTA